MTLLKKSPVSVAADRGPKSKQIPKCKVTTILATLPKSGGARIFKYLAEQHRPCSTAELASNCAVGNVSAAVSKVNHWLAYSGLAIANYAPTVPFQNRYGDKSPMHVWQIVGTEQ